MFKFLINIDYRSSKNCGSAYKFKGLGMRRILTLASISVAVILAPAASLVAQECALYKNAATLDAKLVSDGYLECSVTPEVAQITIKEIGVCTQRPLPRQTETCSSVFSSPSGQTINVSAGLPVSLSESISISEGEYSFAYIVFSRDLAIRMQYNFGFDVQGADGAVGPLCWTNDNRVSQGNVTCGNVASPLTSLEQLTPFVALDDIDSGNSVNNNWNGIFEPVFSFFDIQSSGGVPFDAHVIDSAGNLAVEIGDPVTYDPVPVLADLLSNGFVENSPPSLPITNGQDYFVALRLGASTLINSETTVIDIGFRTTNNVALSIDRCDRNPNNPSMACVLDAFWDGIDLTVRAQ